MKQYLASTDIIDWKHPEVFKRARELSEGVKSPEQIAKRCFEWVRDEILHSYDHQMNPVTCAASEVLRARTELPFCQKPSVSGPASSQLHSSRSVLSTAGLRSERPMPLSARAQRYLFCRIQAGTVLMPVGIELALNAQFCPPIERLAFQVEREGEADLPEIWPSQSRSLWKHCARSRRMML